MSSPIKTIVTGMSASGNKILHKEELGISETERKIKRRVEQKIQQQQQQRKQTTTNKQTTTSNDGSSKGLRKISPSPSSRDQPSISPPSKVTLLTIINSY